VTTQDPANYIHSGAAWSIGQLGAVLSTTSRLALTSDVTLVSLDRMPLPTAISTLRLTSVSDLSSGVGLHIITTLRFTSDVELSATGPVQLPDMNSTLALTSTVTAHQVHHVVTDYLPTTGFLPIR
jgi:hypothetical protein